MAGSAQRGQLLANGRTAEVYAWCDGQVLKLFREGWGAEAARYEQRVSQIVAESGLWAVPAVGELVEVEGRHGILYQRVDGPTMLQRLRARPWSIWRGVRMFTRCHLAMHRHRAPALPSQRERLLRAIDNAPQLTGRMRSAALNALQQLPDGDTLCHGDYHPDNLLLTASGPMVIDWVDASHGNPAADVARSSVLMRMPPQQPPATLQQHLGERMRIYFHRTYLALYRQQTAITRQMVDAWLLPIAAARLNENISELEAHLLALVDSLI